MQNRGRILKEKRVGNLKTSWEVGLFLSSVSPAQIRREYRRKLSQEGNYYRLEQGNIFWPFRPPLEGIFFVQIEKQGRNWRRTWIKEGKGLKEEKSDKTHVKISLWSLNNHKKSTKIGKNLRGGGIFLAGQNIYPWTRDQPTIHQTNQHMDIQIKEVHRKVTFRIDSNKSTYSQTA